MAFLLRTKTDQSSEILEAAVSSTTTVQEMREIVDHAVKFGRHRGQSEAVFRAARDLGVSPRRVLAILRGEVGRIWADELEHARRWYAQALASDAQKLAHEAEIYRQKAEALRARIECS